MKPLAFIYALLLSLILYTVFAPQALQAQTSNVLNSNTVQPAISLNITLSSNVLDANGIETITANAVNATAGNYIYTFQLSNSNAPSNIIVTNTVTANSLAIYQLDTAQIGTGTFIANVILTNSISSAQALAVNAINFTVNSAPAVNSITAQNVLIGGEQTIDANVIGGTPPYSYSLEVSNSIGVIFSNTLKTYSTNASFSYPQNAIFGVGTFIANMIVTDAFGSNAIGSVTYNAIATSTTSTSTTTSITSTSTTTSTTSTSTTTSITSTISQAEVVFSEEGLPNELNWTVSYNGTTKTKPVPGNVTFRPANLISGNATFAVSRIIIPSENSIYIPSPSRGLAFAGNHTLIDFSKYDYIKQNLSTTSFQINSSPSQAFYFNSTLLSSISISMTHGESANISITNSSQNPTNVQPPSQIYQYINITESRSVDQNVSKVVYSFKVPIGFISAHNISDGNIKLFKYYNGGWIILNTSLTGSNSSYYDYSAVSNSLSTYAVGFATANTVAQATASLTVKPSTYPTYFWAGGYQNELGNGGNIATVNWTDDSNFTEATTGGKPTTKYASQAFIGHSTAATGTVTTATTTGVNITIAGIGANVIYSNGAVFRSNASATSDTLSFTVATSNSFVIIGYAVGGGAFSAAPTSTATNCTLEQDVSELGGASSAIMVCKNPEPVGSYTATASETTSPDSTAPAIAIAAYVFPQYSVTFDDSPATGGNVIAGGTLYTSGESANIIGTGNLNASPAYGFTFNGWSVSNSNAIIANTLSSNTLITVEGNTVVTANYLVSKPALSIQYNPVSYGVKDIITATAPSGHSTDTVEIIINGTVVASGTGSASYTVCSTAACLAGGNYKVTAEDTNIGPSSVTTSILHVVQVPSPVLYYIPINFTNSQTIATPAPFQQELTFNSLAYESYEAGNLQNIMFFYANGTVIPSWLEIGNFSNGTLINSYNSKFNQSVKTLYWLNLSKGIPASSTITVYMGFAGHSANLFNTTFTGEAPQLSPTYAEYDTGNKVFIDYWNFNGTLLPSGWTAAVPSGGAVTVHNGVTLQANTSSVGSIIYNENFASTNMIVDYYLSGGGGGFASGWTSGNPAGVEVLSGTSSYIMYSGYLGYATSGQTGGIYLAQSASETSVASPMAIHKPEVFSFYWVDGVEHFWGQYGSEISATSSTVSTAATDTLYAAGDWYYSTNSAYESSTYQWIRTRAYPPNGVMPTATLETIQQVQASPSLAISPNPITYGNLSTITLTGRPSTDTIELLINGNVVAGPSTGTLTYTFNSIAAGFGAGSYTVNALDENSLLSNVQTLTVNKATPKLSLSAPYPSFIFNGSGGSISFDVNSINDQITATLSVNGANVLTTNTLNTYVTSNAIGIYDIEVASASNQNYTAGALYRNFSIFAASVLYKVPITISNSQTVPTLKPFQYMLTANSLQYSKYEASNLDNILFTYANGTTVPSWLESNDTTSSQASIYWLNILNGIPASSNVIVYMDFVSNTINMLNRTRGTGEAPQLSALYGEYDSGFKVFTFYDDFEGNTLNTSLWASSGNVIVDNGLNTTPYNSTYTFKMFNFTNNYDEQVLASIHEKSGDKEEDIGLASSPGAANAPFILGSNRNVSDTAGGYFIYTFTPGEYTDGSAITSPIANTQYMFQLNMSPSASTATIFNTNGPAVLYSSVYGTSSVSVGTSTVGAYHNLFIRSGIYNVFWARVVTRPPNGIEPTASFGAVESTTTLTCTISLSANSMSFGNLYPDSNIDTNSIITDTNSGTTSAYIYVIGTNWYLNGNTLATSFGVSNTLWSNALQTSYTGTALTNALVNTTIPVLASSSNDIYFGLGIPGGAPAGTYEQTITIENSC